MNCAIDNVERRESCPVLSRHQMDDALDAERQAQFEEAYEHHINAACSTIQKTPYSLVTPAYIDAVLRSLACKAKDAHLPELGEAIECFADEVEVRP